MPSAPVDATSAHDFQAQLQSLVRARYPLIHINTFEEDRCLAVVRALAKHLDQHMLIWSTSRGVRGVEPANDPDNARHRLADLTAAIELFEGMTTGRDRHPGGYIFVLLDPYPYLGDRAANPIYRRRLRDFAINIRTKGYHANCVIVSPSMAAPFELEKEITVIDFPMPSREEISNYIANFIKRLAGNKTIQIDHDPALVEKLVDASLGLTLSEVEGALAKALVEDLALTSGDIEKIFRQKQQIIRKSGILEYIDTRGLTLAEIGGVDVFKEWLRIRAATFSPKGRAFGIDPPKGVLLTGIPGCGKSWSAKCVAASWHLPLIRLDMGKVYSSLVGSSEEHMRDAIRITESVAPCILWIDEIEKGLPHLGNYVGDSGVSLRVLGSFLTWLQEKTAPVFVFATANQIDQLPPETLRKGRFDEIFFIDLPTDAERAEIVGIHLRRAKRDPARFDMAELARLSGPDFLGEDLALTGAEIAAWVNEALVRAFDKRERSAGETDLDMNDLRAVVRQTVPLARMRRDEIRQMREWASEHAIAASSRGHAATESTTPEGRVLSL
ncbi:MAG TPA: AAA family ATPase [Stellaceae bacterium]|nr:AAA family ATPase [Stellaceae bacterium]